MKTVMAGILALLGLVVAGGGVWLAVLGGSLYYIVAGIGILVAGLLLFANRPSGLFIYALVIAGSLVWAIYEVGFDWWQLAPRGGLLIVLGLLLLTPWVIRPLARRSGKGWGLSAMALAAAILASAAGAVYSMTIDVHRIAGTFPEARADELPPSEVTVPPAEWHAYGRTPSGSHCCRF